MARGRHENGPEVNPPGCAAPHLAAADKCSPAADGPRGVWPSEAPFRRRLAARPLLVPTKADGGTKQRETR
jgi:hypothetical protein